MSVTVGQLLALVGRLDDTPGFDTPRERLRRFLHEHVSELPALEAIVEETQRSIGEQSQRALQDAIVVLGRFLGFETVFGPYQRSAGAVQNHGHWRSRHRLHVVLEVLTEQPFRPDVDELSRAVAASSPTDRDALHIGLSVVTPIFTARGLAEELRADTSNPDRRIVSTRSLMWLAGMVASAKISHDEVVKLFKSGTALDLSVDLLRRFAGSSHDAGDAPAIVTSMEGLDLTGEAQQVESEPDFWAATTDRDGVGRFERIVEFVVGKRHILSIVEDQALPGVACVNDWICFLVPDKGVVGQAQVGSVVDSGARVVRHDDGSGRTYRLINVELYDAPVAVDDESQQGVMNWHEKTGVPGPVLIPLSRKKFEALTGRPTLEVVADRRALDAEHVDPLWPEVTDRAMR